MLILHVRQFFLQIWIVHSNHIVRHTVVEFCLFISVYVYVCLYYSHGSRCTYNIVSLNFDGCSSMGVKICQILVSKMGHFCCTGQHRATKLSADTISIFH